MLQCCILTASASASALLVAEAPDAVVEAVPALAHVFRAAPLEASSGEQASQASAGGASAVHSDMSESSGAALQLEALRVLLLFLPLPMPQVTLATQIHS